MPPARTLPAISRTLLFRTSDQALPEEAAGVLKAVVDGESPPRLSPKQLAVLAWGQMQFDLYDGGFEQFFYNNDGTRGVPEAARLVEQLGFPRMAATLREAQAIYKRNAKRFQTSDPWADLFGRVPAFKPLSGRFFRAMTSPSRAVGKFVRTHINELFVGDDGNAIDADFTGTVTITRKGVVVESMGVRRGKAHGVYRQFFEDGSLQKEAYYEKGELSANYWPNGQVRSHERTERGVRVKEWYFPSGAVQKRMAWDRKHKYVEPIRLYYENGQIAEQMDLEEFASAGTRKKYFEDGALKLDAHYLDDDENTMVVRNAWNNERKQVVKNGNGVFFDDGCDIDSTHQLFSHGMWAFEMELKKGLRHGRVTTYADGVLFSVSIYRNGQRHGEHTNYYENGRKRSVTLYKDGEEKPETRQDFAKLDNPQPAVLVEVEANERLYTAWDHPLLDDYPQPLNLDQVQRTFEIPQFLRDIDARNRARLEGRAAEVNGDGDDEDDALDEEHWNEFEDSVGFLLRLNEKGVVTRVEPTAADAHSVKVADDYPPILRKLKFRPGRLKGRAVACQVAVRVVHTFREGREPATASKSLRKKRP